MTKWEYMVIALFEECRKAGITDQKTLLDNYGEDQWELTSIIPAMVQKSAHSDFVAYFKRKKA